MAAVAAAPGPGPESKGNRGAKAKTQILDVHLRAGGLVIAGRVAKQVSGFAGPFIGSDTNDKLQVCNSI